MMYDTSISLPRSTFHQWMCWVLFLLVSSVWLHDWSFISPFLLPSTALSGIQLGYVELWLLCARSAKFFNTNKENKWFVTLKSSEIGHSTQILINSDIIHYIDILHTHVSLYIILIPIIQSHAQTILVIEIIGKGHEYSSVGYNLVVFVCMK